jgi:lysyl-tRNA synthetase class 1
MSEFARQSSAWPFQEARQLLDERLKGQTPEKGYVLFETGYGPSGLPHIGTFGEVVRTTMVRNALKELAPELPTRLFAFSDDMDGLRKVPDNIPNQELIRPHLGKPLTEIPDPFGTHESFGHHNNARLKSFLDSFGFDYEFQSATEWYQSGKFDRAALAILSHYEAVKNVILPTLGPERRATYSPFLPVCPKTRRVLQVAVVETKLDAGTIVYQDEDGKLIETPVTGGHCKMQWKADWAMRWYALGVDYEMSGKDLIPSVELSSRICKILGGSPPMNLTYELFLDEQGQKISKSKGNGLAVEDWLKYAPQESLSLFMFQQPKRAKRLFFDVIPKATDEYLSLISKYPAQEGKERCDNPVWHLHAGKPPVADDSTITFGLLLNLVSAAHAEDKTALWRFISRYRPGMTPEQAPMLDKLVGFAIAYYRDFVKPNKKYRKANEQEAKALSALAEMLAALPPDSPADSFQTAVFEVGKSHGFTELREWFKALYETLLGQEQGPRMGSFIAIYGLKESVTLIEKAARGEEVG